MKLKTVALGLSILCGSSYAVKETVRVAGQTLAKAKAAKVTKMATNMACVQENVSPKAFREITIGINRQNMDHRGEIPRVWLGLAQAEKRFLTAFANVEGVPPQMILGSCGDVLDISTTPTVVTNL